MFRSWYRNREKEMGNNSGGTCAVLVHRESARAPADDGCEGQAGESADPRLIAMSDRDPVFIDRKSVV